MDDNLSPDKLFSLATNKMVSALSAFYFWRYLTQAINTNYKGQELAEKNVSMMNIYNGFFPQIMDGMFKGFVIDLSIFFDAGKYEGVFSISKILNAMKDKISEEDFIKLKKEIEDVKRKNPKEIGNILSLRDEAVAHLKIDKEDKIFVIYKEVESVFSCIQEILNLLSRHHNRSFSIWDHIERNTEHYISWVLENLERGEKSRLAEIEEEYRDL